MVFAVNATGGGETGAVMVIDGSQGIINRLRSVQQRSYVIVAIIALVTVIPGW